MLPTHELVEYWLNNYKRVIKSGPFKTEYSMKTIQHTLLISFYPMKVDNKLVGISVFTQDITELKNAVNFANDESTKYKMLFDNVHDYVCVIDTETFRIKHFNQHFANTFSKLQNKGINIESNFLDLVDKDKLNEWKSMFEKVLENGFFKTQLKMHNDEYIDLDIKLLNLKNEGRNFFIFGEDVTTKVLYEKKLEESNKKLALQLQQSINAISKIGEFKDPYTSGHQKKVQALCLRIADEMQLSEQTKRNISFGALIHDIGKLYIASDILNKPTNLTALEYQLVQTHVMNSYTIACEIDFPSEVTTMILQHHERLDGSGYPNGLKENDIILESRILAVADVVEAISSHRPYRPGLGVVSALEEIIMYRGSKFDEKVVDTCVNLFRNQNFEFPEVNIR